MLRRQAAEDPEEIAVRLESEHAQLLIQDTFGSDHVAGGAAFLQVQAGTHTLKVLDGLVEIEHREPEGFAGYLRQMHKPLLDRTLGELLRAQERARQREKQAERDRSRGEEDQDRGGYGE